MTTLTFADIDRKLTAYLPAGHAEATGSRQALFAIPLSWADKLAKLDFTICGYGIRYTAAGFNAACTACNRSSKLNKLHTILCAIDHPHSRDA